MTDRMVAPEFDPLAILHLSKELLASRVVTYVPDDKDFILSGIRCGVLFFMAFWSGPAREAFAELKRVLVEVDPKGRLDLIVIDIDGYGKLAEIVIGGVIGGWGETAWVKDGRVLLATDRGFRHDCFAPNTRALLVECITGN
jgi:hypothetical protein